MRSTGQNWIASFWNLHLMVRRRSQAPAACRRNNSVHAQIFHQLSIVVESMPQAEGAEPELCYCASFDWVVDLTCLVIPICAAECLMEIRDGATQVFHDLRFAPDGVGPVFAA